MSAVDPRGEQVARLLARQKGHRDLEHPIVLDNGKSVPLWRTYLSDALEILVALRVTA